MLVLASSIAAHTSRMRLGTNLIRVEPDAGLGRGLGTLPAAATDMIARIGPIESTSMLSGVPVAVYRNDLIPTGKTGGISVQAVDQEMLDVLGGSVADGVWFDDAKAAYLAARERKLLADATFRREERLWRDRVSSEQDYLDARNGLAEAEIELRAAERCDASGRVHLRDRLLFLGVQLGKHEPALVLVCQLCQHGHQDLADETDPTLVMDNKDGVVTATAKVFMYNEITDKNKDSFHKTTHFFTKSIDKLIYTSSISLFNL